MRIYQDSTQNIAERAAATRQRRQANPYWQAVQDERDAQTLKLRGEMQAYNAARREWEANGKQGKQPSLKDFQAQTA
jgi:hypothetical protein